MTLKEQLLTHLQYINEEKTFDCVKFVFESFDQENSTDKPIRIQSYIDKGDYIYDIDLCIVIAKAIKDYYENKV